MENKTPSISPSPKPPLVLKLCGEERTIKRPMTMAFWAWFWETLNPEGKDVMFTLDKMNLLMPATMSFLVGVPEEDIIQLTPDEEYILAINDLMTVIVEEGVNTNPFFKKGMIHAGMILQAKKTQAERGQKQKTGDQTIRVITSDPNTQVEISESKPAPAGSSPGTGSESS